MKKPQQAIPIMLICIFGIMLILKLVTIFSRQFDPDEFAYLHWAYLLSRGQLPYRDFFFYVTPLFPALLIPLFLLPGGPAIAILGRLFVFGMYLLTLRILYVFTKLAVKDTNSALLAVLLFTAFPMTFDKTIEVRPDMVMTLFFLIGTILLVKNTQSVTWVLPRAFSLPTSSSRVPMLHYRQSLDHTTTASTIRQEKDSNLRDSGRSKGAPLPAPPIPYLPIHFFLSGFLLSLSFLILYKIIFAVFALLFLLFIQCRQNLRRTLPWFIFGASFPICLLLLFLAVNGLVPQFVNATIHDAAAVNVGNSSFALWMTLSPWPLIYVTKGGVSFPWIINTLVWIFMIPGTLIIYKRARIIGIFLIILLAGNLGFLLLFPKPYVQYFIVPSVIASVGTSAFLTVLTKKYRGILFIAVSAILLASFYIQTRDRWTLMGSNKEQLEVLRDVASVTGSDETVYDMVGSYIFRPDGFYICCHPYAQFVHLLNRPIPALSQSLVLHKTKFIVMDQKGYVFWISKPEDLAFLTTQYLPSPYKKIYTLGSRFQCNRGSCIQLDAHGRMVSEIPKKTLRVVIEEKYGVRILPENQWVTIRGVTYKNGDTATFTPALYPFVVSPEVTSFSLQLER